MDSLIYSFIIFILAAKENQHYKLYINESKFYLKKLFWCLKHNFKTFYKINPRRLKSFYFWKLILSLISYLFFNYYRLWPFHLFVLNFPFSFHFISLFTAFLSFFLFVFFQIFSRFYATYCTPWPSNLFQYRPLLRLISTCTYPNHTVSLFSIWKNGKSGVNKIKNVFIF